MNKTGAKTLKILSCGLLAFSMAAAILPTETYANMAKEENTADEAKTPVVFGSGDITLEAEEALTINRLTDCPVCHKSHGAAELTVKTNSKDLKPEDVLFTKKSGDEAIQVTNSKDGKTLMVSVEGDELAEGSYTVSVQPEVDGVPYGNEIEISFTLGENKEAKSVVLTAKEAEEAAAGMEGIALSDLFEVTEKADWEALSKQSGHKLEVIGLDSNLKEEDGKIVPVQAGAYSVKVKLGDQEAVRNVRFEEGVAAVSEDSITIENEGKVVINYIEKCSICGDHHGFGTVKFNLPEGVDPSTVKIEPVYKDQKVIVDVDSANQTMTLTPAAGFTGAEETFEFNAYINDVKTEMDKLTVSTVKNTYAPVLKANNGGSAAIEVNQPVNIIGDSKALFSFEQGEEFDKFVSISGHKELANGFYDGADGKKHLCAAIDINPDAVTKDGKEVKIVAKDSEKGTITANQNHTFTVKLTDSAGKEVSTKVVASDGTVFTTKGDSAIKATLGVSKEAGKKIMEKAGGKAVTLVVKAKDGEMTSDQESALTKQLGSNTRIAARLDVHLEDADGKEITLTEEELKALNNPTFTLKFDVEGENYITSVKLNNPSTVQVYGLDDASAVDKTNVKSSYDKEAGISVTMPNLTDLIVVESTLNSNNGTIGNIQSANKSTTTKTAASSSLGMYAVLAAGSAAALAGVLKMKRKQK